VTRTPETENRGAPSGQRIVGDQAQSQAGKEAPSVERSAPPYRIEQGPSVPKFTDEAMTLICRDIGIPQDPEHRDRLRAALQNAAMLYLMAERHPPTREAQVVGEARQLAKELSAVAKRLDGLSMDTKVRAISASSHLAKHHGDNWFYGPKPGLYFYNVGESNLDQGSRAAIQCLQDMLGVHRLEAVFSAIAQSPSEDKGGRPKDHARANYVLMLARIYEKTTGKSPGFSYDPETDSYRGPFFGFLERNLNIVRSDHGLSNVALGTLLKRVLRVTRTPPPSS
jgi:hypothetical protein